MDTLGIGIKVDPGDSVAKATAVEKALGRTEDRGVAAGKAMLGLAGNFRSLGESVRQHQAALERTHAVHDRLTRQNQPLAQGFGRLAEMMQREKRILDEIHRPMREYSSDLAALDQLLAKNAISTEQYAERVRQLNRAIGEAPAAPQTRTLDGMASAAKNLLTGGALAGVVAAVDGLLGRLEQARQRAYDLEDEITRLENTAQKFTSSTKGVNDVLAEQSRLARDLRSTLEPTMNLYNAVGDAVGHLGLSQREMIDLTRTLGQVATLGNKPLDAAAGIMNRLSVALQSGAAGAGELRTIFRDFPEIGQALAKSWDTNTKGVIEMVTTGKRGLVDIVEALRAEGDAIGDVHNKRKVTHAERKAMQDEWIKLHFKGADLENKLFAAQARGFAELAMLAEESAGKQVTLNDVIEDTRVKLKRVEDAANAALRDAIVDGAKKATGAMRGLGVGLASVADAIGRDGFFAVVKAADPWFVRPETPKKIAATNKEVDEYARLINSVLGPQQEAVRELNLLEQAYARGDITLGKLNVETERRIRLLSDLALAEMEATGGIMARLTPGVGVAAAMPDVPAVPDAPAETPLGAAAVSMWSDSPEARTRAWHDELARLQTQVEKLGQAFRPLGDAIKEAFASGELSAESFADALKGVAMNLLTMGISQAAGPGFLSSLLGGKHGFDYVANGASLQLPGFSNGGDALVRGHGSQDSHLLMARVSPGESLHVRTPQQRMAESEWMRAMMTPRREPGGGRPVIVVQSDPREVVSALGTDSGRREYARLNRQFNRHR